MPQPLLFIDRSHDKTIARAYMGALALMLATLAGAYLVTGLVGITLACGLGSAATTAHDLRNWFARRRLGKYAPREYQTLSDEIAKRLQMQNVPIYLLADAPRWFPKRLMGSHKAIGWSAGLDAHMDWEGRAALMAREYACVATHYTAIQKISGFARRAAWSTLGLSAGLFAFRPGLAALGMMAQGLMLAGGVKAAANLVHRPCERMADYVAVHLTGKAGPLLKVLALTGYDLEPRPTALGRAFTPYPPFKERKNEMNRVANAFAAKAAPASSAAAPAQGSSRAGASGARRPDRRSPVPPRNAPKPPRNAPKTPRT